MSKASVALSVTKLVVHDLEKTAAFYCEAYGFTESQRLQAQINGEPIDEIILASGDASGAGLILMKFTERPAPKNGEVALVFHTDDVDALFTRIRTAGGGILVEPYQSETLPLKVGFATDPEGHLAEVVERAAP